MDEYIEQLLADVPDNQTLQAVVQNILDEPIPEAVKKKPLLPRPIPPPRKRKLEKQKVVLQEFDPLHAVVPVGTRRKLGVNQGELPPLVAAKQDLTEPP